MPKRFAAARRVIFQWRMQVGLCAVALGACVIHPQNVFGKHAVAGRAGSLLLVFLGLALRAWAGGNAGDHTRTATIEAPRLATGGPYAYVRNPIYLASIILGLGMVGLLGDPWMLLLCVAVFAFLYIAIVPAEEQFLRARFGEAYARYCANVPRMLPRLRRWAGAETQPFDRTVLLGESRIALVLVAIYFSLHSASWLRARYLGF